MSDGSSGTDIEEMNVESDCGGFSSQESNEAHSDESEILKQMKQKFSDPKTTKLDRTALLTLAPKSWSDRKLAKEFNTTRRHAQLAKQLVQEKGVFAFPSPKSGHLLEDSTIKLVNEFFNSDENSRQLPGQKDFVSIKQQDGSRLHVQKRLVLCNLTELYRKFKDDFSNVKVGFSKFASLRPKHCVLAGSSGTHTVCVCVSHQNYKLMLDAIKNSEVVRLYGSTYDHFIKLSVCHNPGWKCFMNECKKCPDLAQLNERFKQLFDSEDYEEIEFSTWVTTDRSTLKKQIMPVDDFVDDLCLKLKKLKSHDFIAKQQAIYLANRKENLQENEFIILCDFAENYAFIVQNAVQSFHWNNDQATVHPLVIYRKENGKLQHESFVFISEVHNHDTAMVYCIQRVICDYLKSKYCDPHLVIYFTDGGPQHYKNKYNFKNLLCHEKDFAIKAEWHFHATSHGKGPCDGIGGTVKRLAARASLQTTTDKQILTAENLFDWCKNNIKGIDVHYITRGKYEETKVSLKDRFQTARTISGTHGIHSFIPDVDGIHLQLRSFSNSAEFKRFPKK